MSLLGVKPACRLHSPAFICGVEQMRGAEGADTDLCVGLSHPRMGARLQGCFIIGAEPGSEQFCKVVIKGN